MNQKNNVKKYSIVFGGFGLVCVILIFLTLNTSNSWGKGQTLPVTDESLNTLGEPREISLVQVQVEDVSGEVCKNAGTGVVYSVHDTGIWIATAAHVVENKSETDVITMTVAGETVPCHKWVEVSDADLVFLFWKNEDGIQDVMLKFLPIKTDKASYDALAQESEVEVRGYYENELMIYQGTLTESWIYVEDFAQYMMLAKCEVYPGMSGGGLYDSAGNFIGMVCGGNEDGELVAVPWHVMQARFEEMVK